MNRTCDICFTCYDDATRLTVCPHERFISDEIARQKDLAFSLVGRRLRLNIADSIQPVCIQSIDHRGMVTLRTVDGEEVVGTFTPYTLEEI